MPTVTLQNISEWLEWARQPERRFKSSLGASAAAHILLWLLAWFIFNVHFIQPPAVEVSLEDLMRRPRSPFDTRLPGAPKGAPKPFPVKTHGEKSPLAPTEKPRNPLAAPSDLQAPPEKEKPWVLPGPNSPTVKPKIEPEPVPLGNAAGAPGAAGVGGENGLGGHGGGTGTGEPWVDSKPRLINVEEIRAAYRRNYPIAARQAGRGARVKVELTVGADGRVTDVHIVESGGADFDAAAVKVAQKMLFEPALKNSLPVVWRGRMPLLFNVEQQ